MGDFSKYFDSKSFEGMVNTLFKNNTERKVLIDYIEQLRRWGKYNMVMTDMSPFLLDGRTVLEDELSKELLDYIKETKKFPVDMEDFIGTQPKEIQYIWDNSQKVRELMTTITLRYLERESLDDDLDTVNKYFIIIGKNIYKMLLFSPFFSGLR